MTPESVELRELVEARIRVLTCSVASGADPDGRARQIVAALYLELGMRREAARWLVEAAQLIASADPNAAAALAREAAAADPENAEVQQLLAELGAGRT